MTSSLPQIKPTVFVGSTAEGKRVAEIVRDLLSSEADGKLWSDPGVFRLTYSTLGSLVTALEQFDFAVLILTPDDLTISRKKKQASFRDNMVFEAGLFIGKLGRDRVFILAKSTVDVRAVAHLAKVLSKDSAKSSVEVTTDEKIADLENINFIAFGAFNNLKSIDVFFHPGNSLVGIDITRNNPCFVSRKTGLPTHDDPESGYDYGLIVKVRPQNFPDRTYFVCGGLGEWGTSGSAYFLSNKWESIAQKLDDENQPFAALVQVRERRDESASLVWFATDASDLPEWKRPPD